MFNLGFPEIFMIGVLALVLFGPDKMPELARTVARFIKEFKRMSHELQSTVHETVATLDSDMPKAPSLKELYDRIDPKRAIEEVGVRPFADTAPGSVASAPPAVDESAEAAALAPQAIGAAAAAEATPATGEPTGEATSSRPAASDAPLESAASRPPPPAEAHLETATSRPAPVLESASSRPAPAAVAAEAPTKSERNEQAELPADRP